MGISEHLKLVHYIGHTAYKIIIFRLKAMLGQQGLQMETLRLV